MCGGESSLGGPKESSPPHWFKGNPTTLCLVREWESLPLPLLFPDMSLHQFSFSRSRGGGGGGHPLSNLPCPFGEPRHYFFSFRKCGENTCAPLHTQCLLPLFPDIGPTIIRKLFSSTQFPSFFAGKAKRNAAFFGHEKETFHFSRLRSLGKKCQINNFPPPPFPPLFKTTLHSSMLSPLLPSSPSIPPCPLTSE